MGRVLAAPATAALCPQSPFGASPDRHFSDFSPGHRLLVRMFLSYRSLTFFSSAPGVQRIAGSSYKTGSFVKVRFHSVLTCQHLACQALLPSCLSGELLLSRQRLVQKLLFLGGIVGNYHCRLRTFQGVPSHLPCKAQRAAVILCSPISPLLVSLEGEQCNLCVSQNLTQPF